MHNLAVAYIALGRHAEALKLEEETLALQKAKLGPDHPHTIDSLRELVNLYESWPKPNEAEKWRAKLPQTEALEPQ